MINWTQEEMNGFCEKATELLKRHKKKLSVTFLDCSIFSNSMGSNLHVSYRNEFTGKRRTMVLNGNVLQDRNLICDKYAGLIGKNLKLETKIALRIAYFIFKSCEDSMRNQGNDA